MAAVAAAAITFPTASSPRPRLGAAIGDQILDLSLVVEGVLHGILESVSVVKVRKILRANNTITYQQSGFNKSGWFGSHFLLLSIVPYFHPSCQ